MGFAGRAPTFDVSFTVMPEIRKAYSFSGISSLETTENEYPETKTPVAKRKSKGREAPRISKVLSDLIANRLGSGGLKFGGGVIDTDGDDEVEVEEDVSVSDMALMQILFLGISFVLENETGL